jgi:hypothetical protein
MQTFTTVVVWVLGSLFALYLIVCEFLDAIGRLEIIEKKWPRLHKAMSNRPMRLALLVVLTALVARDIYEHVKAPIPQLNVTIQAPPPPTIQIVGEKTNVKTGSAGATFQIKQSGNDQFR